MTTFPTAYRAFIVNIEFGRPVEYNYLRDYNYKGTIAKYPNPYIISGFLVPWGSYCGITEKPKLQDSLL